MGKLIIYADTPAEFAFGASCGAEFLASDHQTCGYGQGNRFASCRRNKEGATVYVEFDRTAAKDR